MFRKFVTASCAVLIFASVSFSATIVDFEDVPLAANSHDAGDPSSSPFASHGVSFKRTWNSFCENGCPTGWALSNQTDLTTAGFGNPYSAFSPAGGGVNGSTNFAIANTFQRDEAVVSLPRPGLIQGMHVTNTTYGYLAVADGNDGAGFVKGPFGPGDYFKLTIFGMDQLGQETGSVEFLLADFVDKNTGVVNDWTWVDLSSLGNVSSLEFEMSSTDVGQFGMNTPAYFAIDDLTVEFVPEPTGLLAVFLTLTFVLCRARKGANMLN